MDTFHPERNILPTRVNTPERVVSSDSKSELAKAFYTEKFFSLKERFGFIETDNEGHNVLSQILEKLQLALSKKNQQLRYIDGPEANAFVIREFSDVFIYKGLVRQMILWAQKNGEKISEDMIAMILAHELSHLEQKTAEQGNDPDEKMTYSYGEGKQMRLNQEYDADQAGLLLLAEAGYNPREGVKTLHFIQSFGDRSSILSTHPRSSDRIRNLIDWVESNDTLVPNINTTPQILSLQAVESFLEQGETHPGNDLYTEQGRLHLGELMEQHQDFADGLEIVSVAMTHDKMKAVEEICESPTIGLLQAQSIFLAQLGTFINAVHAERKIEVYFDSHHGHPNPAYEAVEVPIPHELVQRIEKTFSYDNDSPSPQKNIQLRKALEEELTSHVRSQYYHVEHLLRGSFNRRHSGAISYYNQMIAGGEEDYKRIEDLEQEPDTSDIDRLSTEILAKLKDAFSSVTEDSLQLFARNVTIPVEDTEGWEQTLEGRSCLQTFHAAKIIELCLQSGTIFFGKKNTIKAAVGESVRVKDKPHFRTSTERMAYFRQSRKTNIWEKITESEKNAIEREKRLFYPIESENYEDSDQQDWRRDRLKYSLPDRESTPHRDQIENQFQKLIEVRYQNILSTEQAQELTTLFLNFLQNSCKNFSWAKKFIEKLDITAQEALFTMLPFAAVPVTSSGASEEVPTEMMRDFGTRFVLYEYVLRKAVSEHFEEKGHTFAFSPYDRYQKLIHVAQNYPEHNFLFREEALSLLQEMKISSVSELKQKIAPFQSKDNEIFLDALMKLYWDILPPAELFSLKPDKKFDLSYVQNFVRLRMSSQWEEISLLDRSTIIEKIYFDVLEHTPEYMWSIGVRHKERKEKSFDDDENANEEHNFYDDERFENISSDEESEKENKKEYSLSMGLHDFIENITKEYFVLAFQTGGETTLVEAILKGKKDGNSDSHQLIEGNLSEKETYSRLKALIPEIKNLSFEGIVALLSKQREAVYSSFTDDVIKELFIKALCSFNSTEIPQKEKSEGFVFEERKSYQDNLRDTQLIGIFQPESRTLKENIDLILKIVPLSERDGILMQCFSAYGLNSNVFFDESLYEGGLMTALQPIPQKNSHSFRYNDTLGFRDLQSIRNLAENYDPNDPSIAETSLREIPSLRWQLASLIIEHNEFITNTSIPPNERALSILSLIPETTDVRDNLFFQLEYNTLERYNFKAEAGKIVVPSPDVQKQNKQGLQELYDLYEVTIPHFSHHDDQVLFSRRANSLYTTWLTPPEQTFSRELNRIKHIFPEASLARDEALLELGDSSLLCSPEDLRELPQLFFTNQRQTSDKTTLHEQKRIENISSILPHLQPEERVHCMLWFLGLRKEVPITFKARGASIKRSVEEIPDIIFAGTETERKELFSQMLLGKNGICEPNSAQEKNSFEEFIQILGENIFDEAKIKLGGKTYDTMMTIWKTALLEHAPHRRSQILIEMIEKFSTEKKDFSSSLQVFLNAMGPVFIKAGQMLSEEESEPGKPLLPEDIRKACAELKEHAKTFRRFAAIQSLEAEGEFDTSQEPHIVSLDRLINAASIKQVYEATLSDGTKVVEKVLRPSISKHLKEDLRIMECILEALKDTVDIPPKLHSRVAQWITTESDFTEEIKNHALLEKTLLARSQSREETEYPIRVATLLHSGKLHIREEIIVGQSLEKLSQKVESDSKKELKEIKKQIFDSLLFQILEKGTFHADPHAGNIFLSEKKEIIFLDVGSVGIIEPELLPQLKIFFVGLLLQNPEQIQSGLAPFLQELEPSLLEKISEITKNSKMTMQDKFKNILFSLSKTKHDIHPGFDLLLKALIGSTYLIREFSPEEIGNMVVKYLFSEN